MVWNKQIMHIALCIFLSDAHIQMRVVRSVCMCETPGTFLRKLWPAFNFLCILLSGSRAAGFNGRNENSPTHQNNTNTFYAKQKQIPITIIWIFSVCMGKWVVAALVVVMDVCVKETWVVKVMGVFKKFRHLFICFLVSYRPSLITVSPKIT